MERRLLSAFLAVMMVLTMAPVAFAADTSVDSYDSLVEAINSASDGDTITLNGDIDVQRTLVVTKKLTLDLAGHKLYNTKDLWDAPTEKDNNWSLISVRENGDLTITGNGTLDAKKTIAMLWMCRMKPQRQHWKTVLSLVILQRFTFLKEHWL